MAVSVTGRAIKVKKKSNVREVQKHEDQMGKWCNHVKLNLNDDSARHFLFTDNLITKALERGKEYNYKYSWVYEVWYEGVMDQDEKKIKDKFNKYEIPLDLASKYNNVRLVYSDISRDLFFTYNEIKRGWEKANQLDRSLPKVSWLSDDVIEQYFFSLQKERN